MRAAIIGFGYMGNMYTQILSTLGWELIGVHDIDPSKIKIGQFYENRQELIQHPNVDVVIISTPHQQHLEILKECLEQHKHVILEKPLAGTIEEADEINRLVEKHKESLVVMVNITHCFYENIRQAKEYLKHNDIGKITAIHDRVIFHVYENQRDWWLFKKSVAGGGVIETNGCHLLARILYLFSDQDPTYEVVGGILSNVFTLFAEAVKTKQVETHFSVRYAHQAQRAIDDYYKNFTSNAYTKNRYELKKLAQQLDLKLLPYQLKRVDPNSRLLVSGLNKRVSKISIFSQLDASESGGNSLTPLQSSLLKGFVGFKK